MKTLVFILSFFLIAILGCDNSVGVEPTDSIQLDKNNAEAFYITSEFEDQIADTKSATHSGFTRLFFRQFFLSPQTDIIIAGSNMVKFSTVVFLAIGSDVEVKNLTIKIDPIYFQALAKATLAYPTETGTGTAEGYFSSAGELVFQNLGFFVKKHQLVFLQIFCDVSTITPGSNISGLTPSIDFDAHSQFKAINLKNNKMDDDPTDNLGFVRRQDDCIGKHMVIRKTKPEVSLLVLPNHNLINGTSEVSRLMVLADASDDVGLRKITWRYDKSSNITLENFEIFDLVDPIAPITLAYTNINNNKIEFAFYSEEVIPAGSSKMYALKATITGVTGQGQYVKFRLAGKDWGIITDTAFQVESQAKFVWSDNSAVAHSFDSHDWTNGYLINLPLQWQILTN